VTAVTSARDKQEKKHNSSARTKLPNTVLVVPTLLVHYDSTNAHRTLRIHIASDQ